MLMHKPSICWTKTPFRKWLLDRVTKEYYSEFFSELKGKTVLEIGCGSDAGAKIILRYFSPQKIIATDFDPRLIAIAEKDIKGKWYFCGIYLLNLLKQYTEG